MNPEKNEIERLGKRIKKVQFNIDRFKTKNELYNRNKIRRLTKLNQNTNNDTKNKCPVDEEIRQRFENIVNYIQETLNNDKEKHKQINHPEIPLCIKQPIFIS